MANLLQAGVASAERCLRTYLSPSYSPDNPLIMETGQIVEQGTRTTRLAAGGADARLYEAQFAAQAAEV